MYTIADVKTAYIIILDYIMLYSAENPTLHTSQRIRCQQWDRFSLPLTFHVTTHAPHARTDAAQRILYYVVHIYIYIVTQRS